ncbi:hypothetical protein [Noviherbaspirillum aridicola]|uniref:OmpA-like domain-containing protein n=1 Tax=Noviherbaspirillum aridicola TaxID=2849687 RepID=A0ABQ4Q9K6_9BURK|nr:hypothetical protein [Noviherbaspirillum aridicola]GIZ53374.1 hypothetical protein NCCP691_33880 [Noviherbaspirillum aridicola]
MRTNTLSAVLAAGLLCGCAGRPVQNAAPAQPQPQAPVQAQAQEQIQAQAQAAPVQPAAPSQSVSLPGSQQDELALNSARIGDREALAFRVMFRSGANALRLSPEAEKSLTAIALRAEKIQLRETFDHGKPADYAPELRDERLRAARAFLVERGVPADRIEVLRAAARPLASTGRAGGAGPVVEIVVQLPEPGGPLRGR